MNAAPHDAGAAHAFARACEQARDLRRAWGVWCRLARAGDLEAWDALERRPAGLRRPPESQAFATLEADMTPVQRAWRAPIFARRVVRALDPQELEPRWEVGLAEPDAAVLACGPWIVHEEGQLGRRALVFRDAASGDEVARTPFENDPSGTRMRIHLRASADRLVACLHHHAYDRYAGGLVLDAGERPGAVLATLDPGEELLATAGDLLLVGDAQRQVSARPLEGGAPRWQLDAAVLGADARGALVMPRSHPPGDLAEVDLRDGAVRWHAPRVDGERTFATAEAWVQVSVRAEGADRVVKEVRAVARGDGRDLWRVRDPLARQRLLGTALAHDALYVATATAERRTVTALDAATGEELFVRTLTPKTGPGPVGLAPVEGGLVVSVQDRARTRVERLG
jgi:hypothetical protein